ncbi:MAG: hypothetical protein LBD44_06340 [Spirochaetaceae bacterium]|jgi:phosphoglycerol transferase|nr:hypothetical protein [Spirochaetaceae bacterium]
MFASQYKNVLFDMDRQLSNFLEWLEGQEFYENTTVVILGDHLYMDSHKYIYQLHVNGKKYQNRIFSHFDIFPALIDSIGGVYDAKGLALGRSMNKGEHTLLEEFGVDHVNNALQRCLWRGSSSITMNSLRSRCRTKIYD